MARAVAQRLPVWLGLGGAQALQQLWRQVAWVEAPAVARQHEALRSGQQAQAQVRQLGAFLAQDARGQQLAQGTQGAQTPQACGLAQGVGQPEVGVAGGVGIEHAPALVVFLAPGPGRQARAEVAAAEVVFGPAEDALESRAVVGYQGKKQRVGLALGGGQRARAAAVDDACAVTQELASKNSPGRPDAARALVGQSPLGQQTQAGTQQPPPRHARWRRFHLRAESLSRRFAKARRLE